MVLALRSLLRWTTVSVTLITSGSYGLGLQRVEDTIRMQEDALADKIKQFVMPISVKTCVLSRDALLDRMAMIKRFVRMVKCSDMEDMNDYIAQKQPLIQVQRL